MNKVLLAIFLTVFLTGFFLLTDKPVYAADITPPITNYTIGGGTDLRGTRPALLGHGLERKAHDQEQEQHDPHQPDALSCGRVHGRRQRLASQGSLRIIRYRRFRAGRASAGKTRP